MSTALRLRRTHDPLALARNLFGFDPFFRFESGNGAARPTFTPSFEVKENKESYLLRADLPGIEEKDLDVSLHNNVLTVSGSRTAEERKEDETYFVHERQYGSFSRSFSLPDEADPEAIDAELVNGVLTLRVGKKADSQPRKISIKK